MTTTIKGLGQLLLWHVKVNWFYLQCHHDLTYPWITLHKYFLRTPSIESYFLLTTNEWNNDGLIRIHPKAWPNFCLKMSFAFPTSSSAWKVCTKKNILKKSYLNFCKCYLKMKYTYKYQYFPLDPLTFCLLIVERPPFLLQLC